MSALLQVAVLCYTDRRINDIQVITDLLTPTLIDLQRYTQPCLPQFSQPSNPPSIHHLVNVISPLCSSPFLEPAYLIKEVNVISKAARLIGDFWLQLGIDIFSMYSFPEK